MKPVRILIADDHELMRRGVRSLLADSPRFEICGETGTGRDAVALAASLSAQIVIMDISMPDMNGLEAARQILKENPQVQVLVLTVHDSEQLVHEVLTAGVRGYILKADAGKNLIAALDALSIGKPYFTSKVAELMLQGFLSRGETGHPTEETRHLLTAREREIVQLVAEGLANKEIAARLEISVKTVESHRAHIMNKLNIHSVTELVRYAIRNGIIQS